MSDGLVTTREMCDVLGVTARTVARWKAAGCPCHVGEGRASAAKGAALWNPDAGFEEGEAREVKGDLWNVAAVMSWVKENEKGTQATAGAGAKKKKKGGTDTDLFDQELLTQRARKEKLLADQYEMQNAKAAGKLIDREAAETANVKKFSAIRNAFLSVPGSIAGTLVGLDEAAIQERLTEAVHHVLMQLASQGAKQ